MSKKPMVVDTALRNTLQHFQQDPRRCKLLGIYWWPMNAFHVCSPPHSAAGGVDSRDRRTRPFSDLRD